MDWNHVRQATQKRLLDAFWKINQTKSYTEITVTEICQDAEISRSTFYEYYKSTKELLASEEARILQEILENPRIQAFYPDAFREDSIKESFLEIYLRNKPCFDVLFSEYGDPAFAEQYKNVLKQSLIDNIRAAGYDHRELDLIVEYEISGFVGLIRAWFQSGKKQPFADIIKLYGELSTTGPISFILKH